MATPFWYNAALAVLKPLYRWRIQKRAANLAQFQQECLERFGPFQAAKNRHAIWFHAVSVGETNAAQPLIQHYLQRKIPVLVTNTTKTGQAHVKALFDKPAYRDLFQAVYLPVDQKPLLQEFFAKYQPRLLALVETEIWPNLIAQAKQANVPCILLNARLSEKSAKGYAKVSGLTCGMLQQLTWMLAQDVATEQRYQALGFAKEKSQVVGNIKFDIQAPAHFVEQAQTLKQEWHLASRKIMTLASTHAPEEAQLLAQLQEKLKQDSQLVCIVVPRHPERFQSVFESCQALGLITQRRSLGEKILPETQVYLADTMGELWLWFGLSQASFVGGSLNEPGGGHNILEPLALNVPTVIGPRYFNFQTIVDEFLTAQALLVGQNAEQVAALLMQCLNDVAFAQQQNQNAQQVLSQNKGSLQQHIALIDRYLT